MLVKGPQVISAKHKKSCKGLNNTRNSENSTKMHISRNHHDKIIIDIDFLNLHNHKTWLFGKLFLAQLTSNGIWNIINFTDNFWRIIFKTSSPIYLPFIHIWVHTFGRFVDIGIILCRRDVDMHTINKTMHTFPQSGVCQGPLRLTYVIGLGALRLVHKLITNIRYIYMHYTGTGLHIQSCCIHYSMN